MRVGALARNRRVRRRRRAVPARVQRVPEPAGLERALVVGQAVLQVDGGCDVAAAGRRGRRRAARHDEVAAVVVPERPGRVAGRVEALGGGEGGEGGEDEGGEGAWFHGRWSFFSSSISFSVV